MPPIATPRKTVHYEPLPPAPPHFPLAPPFNTRMIGFGLPDVSVPEGYLGPRKVEWTKDATVKDLHARLQASESNLSIESYDLRHLDLSGAGIRQACLIWKLPIRRSTMRHLDLRHTHLSDGELLTFAQFLLHSPSALAELRLTRLLLGANNVWPEGFAATMKALAGNSYALVEELSFEDTHVGAMTQVEKQFKQQQQQQQHNANNGTAPVTSTTPTTPTSSNHHYPAASSDASVSGDGADLVDHASIARGQLFQARLQFAQQFFTPLVEMLSASHTILKRLDLSQSCMDDLLLAYLSEGLRHNKSVIEIRLDQNEITDVGVQCLAQALGGKIEPDSPNDVNNASTSDDHTTTAAVNGSSRSSATGSVTGASAAKSSKTSATSANNKKKKVEEEEIQPEPIPLTQPMPVFASSTSPTSEVGNANVSTPSAAPVNSSVSYLSLRSNRIGSKGARALLSMVESHSRLFGIDLTGQRLLSFEVESHTQLCHKIDAACEKNSTATVREIREAFIMGTHARVGANSSIFRTLVQAAHQYVPYHTNSITSSSRSSSPSSSSSHAPNGAGRRVVHSRTSSRVPIPVLTIEQQQHQTGAASSTFSLQQAAINPTPSSSSPIDHVHLLKHALADVWEFIGRDQ